MCRVSIRCRSICRSVQPSSTGTTGFQDRLSRLAESPEPRKRARRVSIRDRRTCRTVAQSRRQPRSLWSKPTGAPGFDPRLAGSPLFNPRPTGAPGFRARRPALLFGRDDVLICNQWVAGSIPVTGSTHLHATPIRAIPIIQASAIFTDISGISYYSRR